MGSDLLQLVLSSTSGSSGLSEIEKTQDVLFVQSKRVYHLSEPLQVIR